MSFQRLRRALLTAAVSSLVLAACGGGESVVSQFKPTRVVAFGDSFSDVGQNGAQYTNNPGTNWTQQLAARYGLSLTASAAGGTSYAMGNARVNTRPDAAGNAATPTVAEQVSTFIGAQSPAAGDLIVVSGGIADVIVQARAVIAGTQGSGQATTNVRQAATDLANQVIRLVNAGAQHVVVVGPYNVGRSAWATAIGQRSLLETLSTEFNTQLLINLNGYGAKVLYVDAALYFNLAIANPAGYGLTDVTSVVCTSVDAGPGIGIGPGQVNSNQCTAGTLNAGVPTSSALFADPVYFTTTGNGNFGSYAYDRVRDRW